MYTCWKSTFVSLEKDKLCTDTFVTNYPKKKKRQNKQASMSLSFHTPLTDSTLWQQQGGPRGTSGSVSNRTLLNLSSKFTTLAPGSATTTLKRYFCEQQQFSNHPFTAFTGCLISGLSTAASTAPSRSTVLFLLASCVFLCFAFIISSRRRTRTALTPSLLNLFCSH